MRALGNPALLEEVLIRHPKLRIYLMHAGYPYLQETKAIMHLYPQVYADLGAISWLRPREEFHEYLRALVRAGFGKRLMFGSDQMVWPEGIGMAIEGIESASFLTPEQNRDIFYNNAVRFLRLDEKNPTIDACDAIACRRHCFACGHSQRVAANGFLGCSRRGSRSPAASQPAGEPSRRADPRTLRPETRREPPRQHQIRFEERHLRAGWDRDRAQAHSGCCYADRPLVPGAAQRSR